MKKQTIIPPSGTTDVPKGNKSRARAAVLAALSVTAIILGIIAFAPQEESAFVELQPVATPEIVRIELASAPTPSPVPIPVPTPEATETPAPSPTATPSPKRAGEGFFTLDILNDTISVAYGVGENTLEKTPGWLTTSALPGEDGMTVLRTLRERDRDTKVLILSARCEVADKVAGLDAGANDYLTKPFHLDELAARIRSLTLRRFTQSDVVLTCAELSFDTKARKASVRGEVLSLTRKETGILEYLLLHQGRPVSQEELLEHVWDSGADGFGNSIRVHISALRKKLRAALGYDPIRNRIGEGYVMEAQT